MSEPYLEYGPLKGGTGPAVPNPDATGELPLHVALETRIDHEWREFDESPAGVKARVARVKVLRERENTRRLEATRAHLAKLEKAAPRKRPRKAD